MDAKRMKIKKHKKTTLFDIVNNALVILITLIVIYPLYFCIIASFSDPTEVAMGNTLLWIKGFTLDAYKYVMDESRLWTGYRNTIIYTILGTLYNLLLTIPAAYVLTKKYMPLHNLFSWFFFFTMYFSGGLIPSYLLIRDLGLLNSPWVMIIGSGVSCYNLIVTRQYFSSSIHPEIYEASYIDGASEISCFTKIALPLAKPIIAVMALYYGVGHWNDYYTAMIYINKEKYYPLQLVLRNILIQNQQMAIEINTADASTVEYLLWRVHIGQAMKYSIIFIASAPLLVAYPFLQKYFAKGVMIGSVKG